MSCESVCWRVGYTPIAHSMPEADFQRTVILSDTHLGIPGRGAVSAQALRPLWAGATRLVLNGDTIEVHDPTWRANAAKQFLELQQFCDDDGVELTVLSGNHDPMISDQRHLYLANGAVFVTHGDILHPAISPWTANAPRLRAMNQAALAAVAPYEPSDLQGRLTAAQHTEHIKWDQMASEPYAHRSKVGNLLSYGCMAARACWHWVTLYRRANQFAKEHAPEARFFIFGHYHRRGIWQTPQRVIVNTGAYSFPSKPLAVVLENNSLEVWPVRLDGQVYAMGRSPKATFSVSGNTLSD